MGHRPFNIFSTPPAKITEKKINKRELFHSLWKLPKISKEYFLTIITN
ncbi:hypothetical protein KIS4809_3739 [Bacillus sp. ZZV12-4809]|nr:hypothetical protein KIS4809_3739 [Bacillus sp. ZZV12-4809]